MLTDIGILLQVLIDDYNELKSSYKVAKKHNVSATAVKRILKNAGVLRTQKLAAKERTTKSNFSYERTDEHKNRLSKIAKARTGEKNPFFGKKHNDATKKEIGERSKQRTGKRNPNYKHGNYQRRPRDFKISEFKALRNFTFNRDDYTCKYCCGMGGHLHAHHIIPYWVKPEAFLDINNLVTVCTKCHFEKAHCGSWLKFDTDLASDVLLENYSLDRERLNELAGRKKTT